MKINKTQLLKEWKSQVRNKWCNICSKCGKSEGKLDCHHIITRTLLITRYDIMNGLLLCPSCHKFNNKCSAHKGPLLFHKWLIETYPDVVNYLIERIK